MKTLKTLKAELLARPDTRTEYEAQAGEFAIFESIKQGLQEAIAHPEGEAPGVQVHYPRAMDVKAVHAKRQ